MSRRTVVEAGGVRGAAVPVTGGVRVRGKGWHVGE